MSDVEFTIDIPVNAPGVEPAAAAVARLSESLTASSAAATAAAAAVTAGQAAYDQAEKSAIKAAQAVEQIGQKADAQLGKLAKAMETGDITKIDQAATKLANLITSQGAAAAKAASTAAAMNVEAASLDKLKAAAAGAAEKETQLAKAHDSAKNSIADAAAKQKAAADATTQSVGAAGLLEGAFSKLGGPLGAVGQKASGVAGAVAKMSKSIGAAGPYVAAAVLAIALATAFVVATIAIAKFGIESADTARSAALLSDGIAQSSKGGRALDEAIYRISDSVPLAREELLGMAGDLAKTGLRGEDLSNALEKAAIKAAKLKFGPDFAKEMLSLPNQAARLKRNISGVFSGLNIEGLLEGLSSLVRLFDKNSATGAAMKVVFESIFQPIVDGLTAIIPAAVRTFIQLEILALKGLIAIKPYGGVLQAIAIGFAIVIGVVLLVAAAFVGAAVAMTALFALFIALPFYAKDAFKAVGDGIVSTFQGVVTWVSTKIDEVIGFFKGLSLSDIGTQLIQGLISGIVGAGPGVLSAITGIAGGAVDAAKKALGIASPSKVFAEIGLNTAAGMQQGVEGGAAGVQGSVDSLVAPPSASSAPASSSSTSTGASYQITIHAGGGDGESIAAALRALLADLGAQAGTAAANA